MRRTGRSGGAGCWPAAAFWAAGSRSGGDGRGRWSRRWGEIGRRAGPVVERVVQLLQGPEGPDADPHPTRQVLQFHPGWSEHAVPVQRAGGRRLRAVGLPEHQQQGVTVTVNTGGDQRPEWRRHRLLRHQPSRTRRLRVPGVDRVPVQQPRGRETVSAPTLQSVSSTGASIGATFSNRDEFEPVGINYYVQYGTQYARYTDQSPTQTATLSRSGSATKSMVLSGLQPATTCHYRAVLVGHEVKYGTSTNYSGAHQTFITAASVGAPSGVPPRVAGAPVIRQASAGNRSARVAFTPRKPEAGRSRATG